MRIYQSSLGYRTFELIAEYSPDKKINLLRSFQQEDEETARIVRDFKDNINSVILDSGVWSKHTHPEDYDHTVHDYRDFLLKNKDYFDFYFSYDEDFDELFRNEFYSKNEDNQEILENAGIKPFPVPVIHLLEDDVIKYYCENAVKYPIVAIGSNAIDNPKFKTTVDMLYEANIKVHAFKIGSVKKLLGLKAWSSDCSSHSQWTSGGRCVLFNNYGKEPSETSLCFRPFTQSGKPQTDYYLNDERKLQDFEWFLENVANVTLDAVITDQDYRTYVNSMYYWWSERYITAENAGITLKFYDDVGDDMNILIDKLLEF